jgi:hypothetical protein
MCIWRFVKFGGKGIVNHNYSMLEHSLSVGITTCLIRCVHLSIPNLDHDLLFYIVENVIGYFVLCPWKQIISFY